MRATEMLKKQHGEVATLFRKALNSDPPKEKARLTKEIVEKLTLHASIEEEIFYPAFREEAGGTQEVEDSVLEAYEEHHVVKFLLEEISEADPKAENFDAKMTVLKEIVEHHVEEEEGEMFPAAEKKKAGGRSARGARSRNAGVRRRAGGACEVQQPMTSNASATGIRIARPK